MSKSNEQNLILITPKSEHENISLFLRTLEPINSTVFSYILGQKKLELFKKIVINMLASHHRCNLTLSNKLRFQGINSASVTS